MAFAPPLSGIRVSIHGIEFHGFFILPVLLSRQNVRKSRLWRYGDRSQLNKFVVGP